MNTNAHYKQPLWYVDIKKYKFISNTIKLNEDKK